MEENKQFSKRTTIYFLTTCALMAALICIFAPMSIPIGLVPVSFTNLVLYFAIYVLNTKGTVVSYTVYLLLGLAGLPVFSGYTGGIAKLAGPTGGYLIGFIPMIIIMGVVFELVKNKSFIKSTVITALGMVLGTAVAYAFGTLIFVMQMQCGWIEALGTCVFPFIPFDLIKIVIACLLGNRVRVLLVKQHLIEA